MPASNETFYNIKRLHVLFAVSSLALLAATAWMVAADHWRPWKVYQRTYLDRVAPWQTEARLRKARSEGDTASVQTLEKTLASQRVNSGKRFLRLPFLDALGRPLDIDQIWLPELRIDYNFREVARFDRCRTCHQAIDKTAPGTADQLAWPAEQILTLRLDTPSTPPSLEVEPSVEVGPSLEAVHGFTLAPEGILDAQAATVGLVLPKTAAARARLAVGDVILEVSDRPVANQADVGRYLIEDKDIAWGEPLTLKVRRGLPKPYCSHPRLDLFVGSLSPHPVSEFGCTVCHDGQGSATDFTCASHTPDNLADRARWRKEHDWAANPFWSFPMPSARFLQSGCLKCHHDVTDLEPSDAFPDPPAEKLLAGYHLVRRNGCFGCHEIRGETVSGESVGPDMRLEPNYHEAATQLLADPTLTERQKKLARQVATAPELGGPRRELVESLATRRAESESSEPLAQDSLAALDMLATDIPLAGTLRKVGPSLRHVVDKLDAPFLDAWIRDPTGFRPETRMPHFYGLHEHLDTRELAEVTRFEAAEIRAITEYLLAADGPLGMLPPPSGATEPPDVSRGKSLFQTAGCLGCHKHADFPKAESNFGPDLTDLGSTLGTDPGKAWLVDWLRDPHRRSPRAWMPDPLLEPVLPVVDLEDGSEGKSEDGSEGGSTDTSDAAVPSPRMTDPAADIAAYLLDAPDGQRGERAPLIESDLDTLALSYLTATFSREKARQYLDVGIPESSAAADMPTHVTELTSPISVDKKLRYVGRQTILKRGCFGCHDIPGFSAAQPIGPALSDFGCKQGEQLAFEQVPRFLAETESKDIQNDPDRAFFRQAVLAHRREGFVWQKLRAPRSFDYQKSETLAYRDRLAMGRFAFSAEEREAVITFVLGLVSRPPAAQYIHQPDRRARAIVEGRKVLDKYGCAECHVLSMPQWQFEFDPDEFYPPPSVPDFEFLAPRFSPEEMAASTTLDSRGLAHAELVGMPRFDALGNLMEDVDDDDQPLYFFTLWEPAMLYGQACAAGGADVMVSQPQITGQRPSWGGALAELLFPEVLRRARAQNSSAAEMEAFGWVPPPLVREGAKVQPRWLYDYLLDPQPIRPAAVLRMPKYNLSSDEAARLVDYFAAVAGVDFPYTTLPAGRDKTADPPLDPDRLDRAMRLLTDRVTFCAKCHLIGDYSPGDAVRTVLAPNLDQVGRRLRPEYLRRWLANPKSALPYTGMPVNFPPVGPPLGQNLLPGESLDQLDTVTELLLNYDRHLQSRVSIREMIESAEPTAPGVR